MKNNMMKSKEGNGGSKRQLPAVTELSRRALAAVEFHGLSTVPPEVEWFVNIDNPRTRRAYSEPPTLSFTDNIRHIFLHNIASLRGESLAEATQSSIG